MDGNYHNNNGRNGGYNSNAYHHNNHNNNQTNGGYRRNYGNKRHYPYVGEYYTHQGRGGQQYNQNHNYHNYGMNSRSRVQHAQHIQPLPQQQHNHMPNGSANPTQGNHYHSHHNSQSSNKVLPPINMYPPHCWPPGIEIEPNFKTYQRPASSPESLIAAEKDTKDSLVEDGSGDAGVGVTPVCPPNQWMPEIPIPFYVKVPPPPLPLGSFPTPPVMFPPPCINPATTTEPEQQFQFNEPLQETSVKAEEPIKDSRLKLASPTPRRPKSIQNGFNDGGRGDPCMKFAHPYFGQHWQNRIDPDELVEAFKYLEIKVDPELVAPKDSNYARLSQAIWNKFEANQQTTETFRKKMELWREVFDIIQVVVDDMDCKLNLELAMKFGFKREKIHLNYGLQIVGSTMSGFGSNTSDVDMCLLIQCPRAELLDMRFEAVDCLHALWTTLSNMPCFDKTEVIYAKVPILKFRDVARNLDVDLNCNNSVGIRNTHLLYCYSQQDWRVRPLVLLIKMWAQFQGINDAKNMTVSSYSFVLMVIHFLQYGVSPPVLPVLQQGYSEKHGYYADLVKVKSSGNDKKDSNCHNNNEPFQSKNVQTLGELLLDFLEYYSVKFDWSSHAVSVRTGSVVSIKTCMNNRAKKNDPHQWKYMCIEEPFEFTNTARSVYDRDAFDRIRGVFFASWQRLVITQDLEAIFSLIHYVEARQIGSRLRSSPSLLTYPY